MERPFLTARWERLGLVTWDIDAARLGPLLPRGLEPDTIDGRAFVSLVAFEFRECRVKGVAVPGCVNFPEVNLRTYVRERAGPRRGVVFIRELVPSRLTAWVARLVYNEPYTCVSMACSFQGRGEGMAIEHAIGPVRGRRHTVAVEAAGPLHTPEAGTTEHFFKEHEWGFGRTRGGRTLAYRVEHPVWRTWAGATARLDVDFAALYGGAWADLGARTPMSVILAEGSAVAVHPHGPA